MTTPPFPPGSRYATTPTARLLASDGREIVYLRRRFIPPADTLALVREHLVIAGDRIDNVAAVHLGDPEQSWQLGDANTAFDLADLTAQPDLTLQPERAAQPGRRLRVTLPQGIPGMPHV